MGDHVSWMLELAVKPGQLGDLKTVMAEMVESTKNESGALIYEWSISDDDNTVHLYERYADSGAVLTHLATFGEKFVQRFLAALDPIRFTVYGTPSDEAREALGGFGPVYMTPFGGSCAEPTASISSISHGLTSSQQRASSRVIAELSRTRQPWSSAKLSRRRCRASTIL